MRNNTRGFAAVPILLLIAVAIAVGAYFVFRGGGELRTTPEERAFQLELEEIRSQGSSDAVPAIEKDLEATSFTEVDSDLAQIESELDVALAE